MSSPRTPTRSIAHSSPSITPTTQHGLRPQELTPRSKVKAMLAAIDDSSDDEQLPDGVSKPRTPLSAVSGNAQRIGDERVDSRSKDLFRHRQRHESEEEDKEDEDEDEEAAFIPRGRMAARLRGQETARNKSRSSPEKHNNEDAYNKIKRQLLSRKAEDDRVSTEVDGVHASEQQAGATTALLSRQTIPDIPSDDRRSPLTRESTPQKSASPGLFVTPEAAPGVPKFLDEHRDNESSDSELPPDPNKNSRFLELVARKKAEREAKQTAEDQKRREKIANQRSFERDLSRDASSSAALSDEDRLMDARLTQQSRPTRKASKKALEEMNRETQRMSRNMQLAHQAKTKKKISKDSLFARFNFRTSSNSIPQVSQNLNSSTATSSVPASDTDEIVEKQSPPTSPPGPESSVITPSDEKNGKDPQDLDKGVQLVENEDDLPSMLDIMSQPLDKGKGKAIAHVGIKDEPGPRTRRKTVFTQRPVRVRQPILFTPSRDIDLDSGSDLEVLPSRKSRTSKRDVFDRLSADKVQEGRSMQNLRALAHLTSPERQIRGKKTTMSLSDMQTSLQKRARQQAVEERAAKIEELKRRGIIVQTAEERQQDQAEVEDLLEKARREGEEIMQKEKRAAKKAKIANGEADDLPDSSDEDEDYQDDQADEPEVELSGSEEDEAEDVVGSGPDVESETGIEEDCGTTLDKDDSIQNALIDNEASEDGDDEQDDGVESEDHWGDDDIDDEDVFEKPKQRFRRNKMVIDDDEDELALETQETAKNDTSAVEIPVFPANALDFGAAPMGMTQAFAATMADTQAQGDENAEEQDSLAFLDSVPEPNFPVIDAIDSLQLVEDSQNGVLQPETSTSKEIDLHFSQSQIQYDTLGGTQGQDFSATQMSEMPDPTQDVGFGLSSPAPQRFASEPASTVDTIILASGAKESSPIKKRGRLQRRVITEQTSSDSEEGLDTLRPASTEVSASDNAFDAMKKARKAAKAAAAKEAFDRKKSEAKGMVEEQAQESEDEYAGLGGASDEDSGEEDEDVNAMMDHGEVKVDEQGLARLYADKERASDEKAVEKLYKDINSGMLRRKRGADFDLSDSDDDAEARRRRKQREFAKMRKALLADENVGKIAEDPRKSAFLQTIEDRENDDDLDFLDRPAEDSFRVEMGTQEDPDSQSHSQQPSLPTVSPNKRKRPLQESVLNNNTNMRPPAQARRTAATRKPASLAEIRESVSFLIEEPGSVNLAAELSSSADEDEENRNGHAAPQNARRTPANPIIDRLSLKRAESASTSSSSRLAFHDPATYPSIGGFKVPSLLRRATTSQLNANGADANGISTHVAASTERAAGGGEKGDYVRRGGSKRSSINFAGREKERKGAAELVEKRRKEERERIATERRNSGLGELGVGRFE